MRKTSVGARVRRAVHERDEYRCVSCGAAKDLTIDHIKPVYLGGTDDLDNLQTLCHSCNASKGLGSSPRGLRDARISQLLKAGWSHTDVARRYGVERQRIQQVAARLGIGPSEVILSEIPGGYAVVGGEGTDEEAIRARIETALRTAKLEMRYR